MKTIQIIFFTHMLMRSVYSQEAVPTDIEQFLKTRSSYEKIDLDSYNSSTTQYQYDVYFCDAAYKSVRGNIIVTALVRKKAIIGYHIQVSMKERKNSPYGSSEIEEAISISYDLNRYEKMTSGMVGDNDTITLNWIYVDKAKINEAKRDVMNDLAQKIKP